MRDKLKSRDDWERIQKTQSLHELIAKIEKICVGFDDHKQEVFNLVQSLKTLFLHTQSNKETVEEGRIRAQFQNPVGHRGGVRWITRSA